MALTEGRNMRSVIDNVLHQCGALSIPTLTLAVGAPMREVMDALTAMYLDGEVMRTYTHDGRAIYSRRPVHV